MKNLEQGDEPMDHLTRIAAMMLEPIENEPCIRGVVMLTMGDGCGMAIHGYDDQDEAAVDMLVFVQALLESQGKQMIVLPMEQSSPN